MKGDVTVRLGGLTREDQEHSCGVQIKRDKMTGHIKVISSKVIP